MFSDPFQQAMNARVGKPSNNPSQTVDLAARFADPVQSTLTKLVSKESPSPSAASDDASRFADPIQSKLAPSNNQEKALLLARKQQQADLDRRMSI